MPRALKVKEVASRFFPSLTLLFVDDDPVPELSKLTHQEILKLNILAWRLQRARARKSLAENRASELRDTILERVGRLKDVKGEPFSLYGFRTRLARGTETKFVPLHSSKVVDNVGFIQHLGEHAGTVITGIQLVLSELIKEPADFERLFRAVADEFGEEVATAIRLTYDRDALKRLTTKDKVLDEVPSDVFEEVVGSVQIRVSLVDPPPKK